VGQEVIALIQSLIPLEWIAAFAVVVSALTAIWFGGRKSGKSDAKIKELDGYVETRKKMDDAGRMSDADAAREWLHDRSKR
jgi:hypothetical protein